jgi:4-aminobutyrate aminotransferase/4-aminobutyrate aminotransferase/(S)-3-amino-2-methylpropionate transaminase
MPAFRKWMPGGVRWPNFRQIPSGDAYRPLLGEGADSCASAVHALEADLDSSSSSQVAALIMEVVQGPNGHSIFEKDYYAGVQRVCRERGVLLIVDEIQTGLGRCGTTWASDLYDVRPDILVVGKALGGGFPIGAFVTRKELIPPGLESEPWHMLTFMNQPLAAAAGIAVLDIIEKENLTERARALGAQFTEFFTELAQRYDVIGDVRGPGLFVGVDFVEDQATKAPATDACRKAWEFAIDNGLITQFGGFAANVYKFKPPLTTPKEDFESMLGISQKMVTFIQAEVDRQRKGRSVRVPATVGE